MIRNYFTIAFRNLTKSKVHTGINVIGLSLGLMAGVLAFMFVLDELSFDQFHNKRDRLYRLNKIVAESNGGSSLTGETSGLMGPTMVDEFPEVQMMTRYQPWFNAVVLSYNNRSVEMKEQEIIIVDSTFFEIFDFRLLQGETKRVLARPATIVLTPNIATALFGNEDPIGKIVKGINNLDFEVTGIAEDSPRKSHIQYKALISWTTTVPQLGALDLGFLNNWITQVLTTYILVDPNASVNALQSKFSKFMADHLPTRVENYQLYLQPFNDIYLNSYKLTSHRMAKLGSAQFLYVFSFIAAFILFIACANYINISTSKSIRRAREVGMRKSLGASRQQLIKQFLGESLVITVLSALLAFLLLYLAIPFFNDVADKSLTLKMLLESNMVIGMVSLIIVVSIIAGLYPAFILSSFKPAETLKASFKSSNSGTYSRNILIIFQFVISIIMIASTILVYQQMRFIFTKDLGFDKEHVLVLNLSNDLIEKSETFTNEVKRHKDVLSTSLCRTALASGSSSTFIAPEGFPPDQIEIRMFPVDANFKDTYGLEMSMGRFFDREIASDSNAVIINEALMRQLQWENPMEKTIKFQEDGVTYNIVGVLKDFNYKSLYEDVEPLVMWIDPERRRNLSIRFTGNPAELISFLEMKWKEFEPLYPFKYYFIEETFARAYESDSRLFKTLITFACLSIVIACLGLYGLVSYIVEQRSKEFGIRKVLGATIANINYIVNRKFILLVALASFMAVPAVIPLVNFWLKKFAVRIEISFGVFVMAILITLMITILAVSIQAIKAGMANPAESLKQE